MTYAAIDSRQVRLAAVDCVSYLIQWADHAADVTQVLADLRAKGSDPIPAWLQDPDPRVRIVAEEIAAVLSDPGADHAYRGHWDEPLT